MKGTEMYAIQKYSTGQFVASVREDSRTGEAVIGWTFYRDLAKKWATKDAAVRNRNILHRAYQVVEVPR